MFVTTDTCVRAETHCASRVYVSPVGRDDWRVVARRLPTRSGVTTLVVHGAAWFAASIGGVFHGNGDASPVERLPEPCQESYAGTGSPLIAAADAQHLDAVCVSGGAMGTATYQLFGSTNGGADWRQAGRDFRGPTYCSGIADNAHGVLVMAASSGGSEILRTTNDAKTVGYDHLRTPTGGIPWTDIGFTTAVRAVAVLDHKDMYISNDAGRIFTRVSF